MASPPNTADQPLLPGNTNVTNNIKKCGYLKKQKHGHKRFFVLKEPSEGSPARLEYYESEKKWKNKSAAKRVVPLDCCLNINKRADAKHKYLIALYTKDEYFAVAAENEQEQESWYRVLTDLMAEGSIRRLSVQLCVLAGWLRRGELRCNNAGCRRVQGGMASKSEIQRPGAKQKFDRSVQTLSFQPDYQLCQAEHRGCLRHFTADEYQEVRPL